MVPGFGKFNVLFTATKEKLPSPYPLPSSTPLKYLTKCTLHIIVFLTLFLSFNVHPSHALDHLPGEASSENKAGKIYTVLHATERTKAIYNPFVLASFISKNTLSIKMLNDLLYNPHISHVLRKIRIIVRYVQQCITLTLSAINLILKLSQNRYGRSVRKSAHYNMFTIFRQLTNEFFSGRLIMFGKSCNEIHHFPNKLFLRKKMEVDGYKLLPDNMNTILCIFFMYFWDKSGFPFTRTMRDRTRRQETFKMSKLHVIMYRIGSLSQIRK